MNARLLHRPALEALLAVATSPTRWRSRSHLASDCGFTSSTFSNALREENPRSLSENASASLAQTLGIDEAALWVPLPAVPHDLRVAEELRAIKALSDRAADLVHGVSDLHTAITARTRGD